MADSASVRGEGSGCRWSLGLQSLTRALLLLLLLLFLTGEGGDAGRRHPPPRALLA